MGARGCCPVRDAAFGAFAHTAAPAALLKMSKVTIANRKAKTLTRMII